MNDVVEIDWSESVHAILKAHRIEIVPTVPDGGLTNLLRRCEADKDIRVVTLSTEQDGVALAVGAWLGGVHSALMMQSSGIGNILNMLTLASQCRAPLPMLITMRGEWGEFNPWQIPMGQGGPDLLERLGVRLFRPATRDDIAPTFAAAAALSRHTGTTTATLIGQHLVGTKTFDAAGARDG